MLTILCFLMSLDCESGSSSFSSRFGASLSLDMTGNSFEDEKPDYEIDGGTLKTGGFEINETGIQKIYLPPKLTCRWGLLHQMT
eukprot:TRINITY_DN12835_c0_g1_i1.p1 TRINITY_DN12835_c0_g1~~TRINITY_DN12835_c0_g1_i1.p1  ORF type:complete len:84 (-),score=21.42 TRINITY_DN12835_c0_g1_i1:102-353(-)